MREDADREQRRRALEAVAEEVFDQLFAEDLAALLARYGTRSTLRDGVAERAGKVIDKLAATADAVGPQEHPVLVAACLTQGRSWAGFAQNTGHAATKFQRYRRFAPLLPLGILARTDRIVGDDELVIELLAESLRVRAGVLAARACSEPELILNAVVPAVVAAHRSVRNPAPGAAEPDAGTLVDVAVEVLERGAGFAAAYRAAGRPVPVAGTDLPVAGNADFLVRIAAYRLAIEEHRGQAVARPMDGLQQAVADLTSILRAAMTRPARRPGRRGPDEPDVATAIRQFAGYLGAAAGDDTSRRAAGQVHTVLNYQLGLDEPPPVWLDDTTGDRASVAPDPADQTTRLGQVQDLVGWLIAKLFQGACQGAREGLLEWLDGTEVTNQQAHLPLLVRRLRVAIHELDRPLDGRPPRPHGVTPVRLAAMSARLVAAVDPGEIHGHPQADARLVTLDALPPLWTRRGAAVHLLTAHLRVRFGSRRSTAQQRAQQAVLVATHGVRAPVQFVRNSANPVPGPCCADAAGGGRPVVAPGRPREPVHHDEICPHRPWGEIGLVENYRTLGEAAGCTAEAARKQLARYQGPWAELLLY